MSIELRALNAQHDGSVIEIARPGGPAELVLASPRHEVREMLRLPDGRALVLLGTFSRATGEVALLDIDAAKILRRTPLPEGTPHRILRSPDGRRIAVLGRSGIAILDGGTLALRHLWSRALRTGDDMWRLQDAAALSRAEAAASAGAPQGADHFVVRPLLDAAAFRDAHVLRTLSVTDERIEHGKGYYYTFRAAISVDDIDLDAGTMHRRTLWSGWTRGREDKGSAIIGMDPAGRVALIRHSGRVATPEEAGRGLGGLLRRIVGQSDRLTPPPGMIAARAEVWDLDALTQGAPLDLCHVRPDALLGAFEPNRRPGVMLRYDAPLAPSPMARQAGPVPDEVVHTCVASGLVVDAAWMPDGTVVVLLHHGLLRQIRADGTVGPLLRPDALPYFGLNAASTRLPLEEVRLRPEGPDRIVLASPFAEAEVALPPFAAAGLADPRERRVPVRVIRERALWDAAFKTVRQSMRRLRPANIPIPDASSRSIVAGLPRMAAVLRDRYDELVAGGRWSPTFLVGDSAFPETAFCAALLDTPVPGAAEALDTLVRAFMRHQRATVDVTAGEDETARGDHVPMCLAETVLTAIRLSDRIPAGCWRWIVRRDGQHDTHTTAVLGPRVIDPLGLQGRDDLVALAVRVGLQDFATQDWEGSLLRIGAMPSVAAELHAGRLAPDRLAHVLRRQLRAEARGGGLSWSTEAGERGVLAEIARRLDPAQPAGQALARHLAD